MTKRPSLRKADPQPYNRSWGDGLYWESLHDEPPCTPDPRRIDWFDVLDALGWISGIVLILMISYAQMKAGR